MTTLWQQKREILHRHVHQMISSSWYASGPPIPDIDLDIIVALLGYKHMPMLHQNPLDAFKRVSDLRDIAYALETRAVVNAVIAIGEGMMKPGVRRGDYPDRYWQALIKGLQFVRQRAPKEVKANMPPIEWPEWLPKKIEPPQSEG